MSLARVHHATFKRGSKTYFNSSLFFPPQVRRDVFVLYGFVRVADDFVDRIPQDPEGFHDFRRKYEQARRGRPAGDTIVDAFVELGRRRGFDPTWTEAFFHSMAMDLSKREYDTLAETLEYIYGSAEVIGLFMARVMDLPADSYPYAQRLGRAMQYINFIRDVDEDRGLGRRYLPLDGAALRSLQPEYARSHAEEFNRFLRYHLAFYRDWQKEAEEGFRYLPRRYLIPIKTASAMYNWTARTIARKPLIVFEGKVKPAKARIWLQALANAFDLG